MKIKGEAIHMVLWQSDPFHHNYMKLDLLQHCPIRSDPVDMVLHSSYDSIKPDPVHNVLEKVRSSLHSYKNLFSSHYLYEVWSSSQHYWKSQIQFTLALKADPVHNALENSDSIPLDAVGTKNIRKHNLLTLINRGLFCSVQLCASGKHVTIAQIIE